jgi:hypothetical protein
MTAPAFTGKALKRHEALEAWAKASQVACRHPDTDDVIVCGDLAPMVAWAAHEALATARAFVAHNDFPNVKNIRIDVSACTHYRRGLYVPAIKATVHWPDIYSGLTRTSIKIAVVDGTTLEALTAALDATFISKPSQARLEAALA